MNLLLHLRRRLVVHPPQCLHLPPVKLPLLTMTRTMPSWTTMQRLERLNRLRLHPRPVTPGQFPRYRLQVPLHLAQGPCYRHFAEHPESKRSLMTVMSVSALF